MNKSFIIFLWGKKIKQNFFAFFDSLFSPQLGITKNKDQSYALNLFERYIFSLFQTWEKKIGISQQITGIRNVFTLQISSYTYKILFQMHSKFIYVKFYIYLSYIKYIKNSGYTL